MRKNLHQKAIIILLLTIYGSNSFGQKFVKATGAGGTGSSWDSPLIGITGLVSACQAGGTVYVAAGNYAITSWSTFIKLSQATHIIQGGFPANATGTNISNYNPITNLTTIDGNNNQIFIVSNIVGPSITVSIKGFMLANAVDNYGDNLSSVFLSDNANAAGPTLANYTFTDLTVSNNRYAFDISGLTNPASRVLFKNCYFNNNVSINPADCIDVANFGSSASPASAFMIDSCNFVGNHAAFFAEVHLSNSYGVTFQKSNFCNNNTVAYGGSGICSENSNNFLVEKCNFRGNGTGTNNYGALCIFGNSSTVKVSNSVFYGNYISGNNTTAQNADVKAFNSGYTLANCSMQCAASTYSGFTTQTNNVYSSLSDPGSCATAVILPITGLVLAGQMLNGLPQLTWATLTEHNSSYFEVQSSVNGTNYKTIGKVYAAGNSNAILNYSFVDNAPNSNTVYYRLAIVDKDGASSYSNTVSIKTNGLATPRFNIYPNPAISFINIETGTAGTYQLELINAAGQRVQLNRLASASGILNMPINRSSVISGMYIVKITNAEGSFWHRTVFIQ